MYTLRALLTPNETGARYLLALMTVLLSGAGILAVVVSPALALGIIGFLVVVFAAWWRPHAIIWLLLAYLPFEPFLLKWIPDAFYVLARYASEGIIYIVAGTVLLHAWMHRTPWRSTPADVPFFFFLIALAASVVTNVAEPTVALLGVRQILRFILLYFVMVYIAPTKAWIRRMMITMAMVVLCQSSIALLQAATGGELDSFLLPSERRTLGNIQLTLGTEQFWDPGQRVFATMGRYDQLGTFLAAACIMLLAFFYERRLRGVSWYTAGVIVALALPALVLTYSRSSWFGWILGSLAVALLVFRDRRVAIAASCAPIVLLAYVGFSQLAVTQLVDTPRQSIAERFFEAFSYERWRGEYLGYGRLYWIVETVAVVVPSSPLFGVGPGYYGGGVAAALQNTKAYDALGLPFGVYGSLGFIDNNWMSLWGELGTVGLGAYLWFYGVIVMQCLRVAREHPDADTRALAAGTFGILLAFALNASLATFFEVRTLAPYVWIFAGIVAARDGSYHLAAKKEM